MNSIQSKKYLVKFETVLHSFRLSRLMVTSLLVLTFLSTGCSKREPVDVVGAALSAAREGNDASFLSYYREADQRALMIAIGVAVGGGWVPLKPLTHLAAGTLSELSRNNSEAVVEIAGDLERSYVCLVELESGWAMTLREVLNPAPEVFSCGRERGSEGNEIEGRDALQE
jgi:hypothetical protein